MPSSSSSNSHDKNEDGSPITPSTPTTTTTTSRAGSRLSNIFTFGRTRSQAQPQVEQQVEHESEDQAVPPRRSSLESVILTHFIHPVFHSYYFESMLLFVYVCLCMWVE